MFSNFINKIDQKWNEFLYGPFCSRVKNLFSDYGHVIANPTQFTVNQPTKIDLQERFKTCKENSEIFLSAIGSFDQFCSYLPDENLRKELIEHYKEGLPILKVNAEEKMNEFINDYQTDGWEMVENDYPLPDEEINEKPGGQIQEANITNLWNLIGRVLG